MDSAFHLLAHSAATHERFVPKIPFHHGQSFITTSPLEEAPHDSPDEGTYVVATLAMPHNYSDCRSPGYQQSYLRDVVIVYANRLSRVPHLRRTQDRSLNTQQHS